MSCAEEGAAPEEDEDEWDDQGKQDLEEGEGSADSNDPKNDEGVPEDQLDEGQGNVYVPETAIIEPSPHDTEAAANVGKKAPNSQGHGSDPGHQNEHQVGTEAKMHTDQPIKEKVAVEEPVDKSGLSSSLVALHQF